MTRLEEKQLEMRMRGYRLTPAEKYEIHRGWSKTLLKHCELTAKSMRGKLDPRDRVALSRLNKLLEIHDKVFESRILA